MSDDEEELRPRQSGMERQHELWIRDVLNHLNALNIPVWRYKDGKRVQPDYTIPERLALAKQAHAEAIAATTKMRIALASRDADNRRLMNSLEIIRAAIDEIIPPEERAPEPAHPPATAPGPSGS